MENNTAKHFVLQLGSLASLYLSVSFLLVLLFGIINLLYPDATDTIWQVESASSSVRLGIAFTLVFFPAYLILTRIVNRNRRSSRDPSYLGLTKWLIYLSLLIGGGIILGDLVITITTFLEGEITQRFILKVSAVLFIIGAAFHYYILDAKQYWVKNEQQSIMYAIGASLVVFTAIGFGFANVDSPAAVREQKLDLTQIQDLQNIQWQIQEYLVLNEVLPESLKALYKENGLTLPTAPEVRPAYSYEVTERGFTLCATFSSTSRQDEYSIARPLMPTEKTATIINPDSWKHGSGEVCFERIVQTSE